jgi:hypothetical protein
VCMTKLESRDGLRVNEIMLNVFNVVAIYYYNIALLLQVHSVFSLSCAPQSAARAPTPPTDDALPYFLCNYLSFIIISIHLPRVIYCSPIKMHLKFMYAIARCIAALFASLANLLHNVIRSLAITPRSRQLTKAARVIDLGD